MSKIQDGSSSTIKEADLLLYLEACIANWDQYQYPYYFSINKIRLFTEIRAFPNIRKTTLAAIWVKEQSIEKEPKIHQNILIHKYCEKLKNEKLPLTIKRLTLSWQ